MPGLVNDGVADHEKRLRWAIALLIVVALASFTIASYLPSTGIASCHEELADSGIPVSVCGPIGAADIVLIGLVLLLAAALVLSELSEIGLPGGISIKRRVAELDREQRKTADDVRSLTLFGPGQPPAMSPPTFRSGSATKRCAMPPQWLKILSTPSRPVTCLREPPA